LKNLKGTKPKSNKGEKQGVFHNVWPLCHFTIKKLSEGKEKNYWKLKCFTMQKYNLPKKKNPLKKIKKNQKSCKIF